MGKKKVKIVSEMVKTTVKVLCVQDKEALETKVLRRGIARVLSTIQQKHRDVLKKNFEKTKAVLSRSTTKNSRAIRKALTKHQRNKKNRKTEEKGHGISSSSICHTC